MNNLREYEKRHKTKRKVNNMMRKLRQMSINANDAKRKPRQMSINVKESQFNKKEPVVKSSSVVFKWCDCHIYLSEKKCRPKHCFFDCNEITTNTYYKIKPL